MSPRILIISSVLSLVMCAATLVLWVRSYGGSDYLSRFQPATVSGPAVATRSWTIELVRGDVRFGREETTVFVPAGLPAGGGPRERRAFWRFGRLGANHLGADLPEQHASVAARLGFYRYSYGFMSSFSDSTIKGLSLPAWLFVAVFGGLPAIRLALVLRCRLRRRSGRCPRCNYDLRASTDRCPECGIAPSKLGRGG